MIERGRLLRLKNMVDSAAGSIEANVASALSLTDAYARLRTEVLDAVSGTDLAAEFERVFPEAEAMLQADLTPPTTDYDFQKRGELEVETRRARSLLGQLAGWVEGLIAEQTLQQRLRYEAEARMQDERRQPPGFTAPPGASG